MSCIRPLVLSTLLATSGAAFAEPEFRLEAGYTQFRLEHQLDESQNLGGLVLVREEETLDSSNAAYTRAELAWSAGENLEWIAAASGSYGTQGTNHRQSRFVPGSAFRNDNDLDKIYMLGLQGGLRWQHALATKLKLHADAALSLNQWRYHYIYSYLDFNGSQFVTREATWKDDDRYLTLDGTVGLYYAFTPALDAVLDATGQLGQDYRNTQFNAGLRYRFR